MTVGVALAAIAAIAWPEIARAQSTKVAAEALFEEGRRLMAKGSAAQACPKFVESEHLDPSPSTLLNLGACYERLGKTASAWATYREAASIATTQNRQALVPVAQRHAAALEPDLARMVITVSAPVDGMDIRRDGAAVGRGEWDVAVPVDPGVVVVEASAPHKKRWSASVDMSQPGKTVTTAVPALEDAPFEQAEAGGPGSVAPGPVATMPGTTTTTSAESSSALGASESRSRWSAQKTTALVTGGVGVVGVAVGTIFVLSAKSKYDDSLTKCHGDGNLCTADGVSLRDDARRAGTIATVAYGIGAVGLVGGVVLWFTAPKTERSPAAARIGLAPTPSGLVMTGRWW